MFLIVSVEILSAKILVILGQKGNTRQQRETLLKHIVDTVSSIGIGYRGMSVELNISFQVDG